ncbi:beta strand repeat-containing protein, partial [Gaoshiqia sediminis]
MTKRTKQIIAALLVWAYLLLNITSTLQANYLITPEAKPTLAFTEVVWPASSSGYLQALASNPAPLPPANVSPTTNTDHTNAPEFGVIASAIVNNSKTAGAAPRMAALPPTVTATATEGLWDEGSSWEGGAVPNADDDVVIPAGATITINTDPPAINSLTVNGTLVFESGTSHNLTVNTDVTIATGATLTVDAASSLTISGNWTNNGTFNAGNGTVTFDGTGTSISGTSTTGFNNLQIPSGASVTLNSDTNVANLTIDGELTTSNSETLTVSGNWTNNGTYTANAGTVVMTGAGKTISGIFSSSFNNLQIDAGSDVSSVVTVSSDIVIENLSLVNGLLSVTSGTTDIKGMADIPQTAGLELNGSAANLITRDFTITNKGLIHIVDGVATFGNSSGNSVNTSVDGAFVMEGGTANIAGRLHNAAGDDDVFLGTSYEVGVTISGGTLNLATKGNGSNDTGSLDIDSSGYFDFNGGTINFINSSTAARDIDLRIDTPSGNGTKSIAGGSFVFGDGVSSGEEFVVSSAVALTNLTATSGNTIAFESEATTANTITVPASYNGLYTFQFGNGTLPVTIDLSGATFAGGATIEVTMQSGKHPENKNTTNYLNRHWTVTTSGITDPNYDLTAKYLVGDVVGGNEAGLIEGTYNGSVWTNNGSVDDTNHLITISGLNSNLTSLSAFEAPTATLSGAQTICPGTSADLSIALTGAAPWNVFYNDGSDKNISGILSSPYTLTVTPGTTTIYTLISVTDANLAGTVSGTATVTVEDNEDPIISCVGNQSKDTDTGTCTYTVQGTEFDPTAFA